MHLLILLYYYYLLFIQYVAGEMTQKKGSKSAEMLFSSYLTIMGIKEKFIELLEEVLGGSRSDMEFITLKSIRHSETIPLL